MMRNFRVVAQTNAGVMLPATANWSAQLADGGTISAITGFDAAESAVPIPRVLYILIDLEASSLDEAIPEALEYATGVATIMAFVGNSFVDSPEPYVAYDTTDDDEPHEFTQTYQPARSGLPQPAALLDCEALDAVIQAGSDPAVHKRISVAMIQYNQALRNLRRSGEVLAAGHLFMAVDALGKLVERKRIAETGVADDRALAVSLGIDVDREDRHWRNALAGVLRAKYIFAGDDATYKMIKEASDGFEHGFLTITQVRSKVDPSYAKAFGYVRQAIIDLLDLPEPVRTHLAATQPVFNDRLRAQVRGLIDPATATGPEPPIRHVDFTVDLVSAAVVDGSLNLSLQPQVSGVFQDGATLAEPEILIYRDRLDG